MAPATLVDFKLPPFGTVRYLKTEADLRDVPLWQAHLRFSLYQDAKGAFTQAAAIEDEYTLDSRGGSSSRLDQMKEAAEQLRKKHIAFLKARGLPAMIERVDGKENDRQPDRRSRSLAVLFKDEQIDPAQWASEHRRIGAAVANTDLRTYNPPVDQQGSDVLEFESIPTDRFGCGGVRWTIQPSLMLEGFRKGHVVRLFIQAWKIDDMPFGEGLYTEAPGPSPPKNRPTSSPIAPISATSRSPLVPAPSRGIFRPINPITS